MLSVGIPKEIKNNERRVALIPDGVRDLTEQGITVLVESCAGRDAGYRDQDYIDAGAQIAVNAEQIYANSGFIQKVKEPQPSEYRYLKPGSFLFCFLHLASPENKKLIEALVQSGVTAIGYETLQEKDQLPILAPMSEIAGGLGAAYLRALIPYFDGVEKAVSLTVLQSIADRFPEADDFSARLFKAVIFGGGIAGVSAYQTFKRMRVEPIIVEPNPKKLMDFKYQGLNAVEPGHVDIAGADILMGCAHSRGARAARVLTEADLARASLNRRKILVDIAIDQGGNFPDAKATTYDDPVYRDQFGNTRFAVANIPALAGPSASRLLSEKTSVYTKMLALNPNQALASKAIKGAVNIASGKICLKELT